MTNQNILQHKITNKDLTTFEIENLLNSYNIEYKHLTSYKDPVSFQQKHTYLIKVNKHSAKTLLDNHRNPNNRNLKKLKIDQYIRDFENGRWQDNGDRAVINEDLIIANCHHRLTAISRMTEFETWMEFLFGISRDVNAFDLGSPRTLGDQLGMIGEKVLKKYSSIITYIGYLDENNGIIGNTRSPNEKIETAKKFENEILKYEKNFKELNGQVPFWAYICFLAGYENNKYTLNIDNFVSKILSGANLDENSPILLLRKYLLKEIDKGSSKERKNIGNITAYCFYAYLNDIKINKITPKVFNKKYGYDLLVK